MNKRSSRFHVFVDAAGEWRWRLVAANGRVICQGESHPTKQKAVRAAEGVKAAAGGAAIVVDDAAQGRGAKTGAAPSAKMAPRRRADGGPMSK